MSILNALVNIAFFLASLFILFVNVVLVKTGNSYVGIVISLLASGFGVYVTVVLYPSAREGVIYLYREVRAAFKTDNSFL